MASLAVMLHITSQVIPRKPDRYPARHFFFTTQGGTSAAERDEHDGRRPGTVRDSRNHDLAVGLKARLDQVIERALEERRIVGTVVLVAKGGEIAYSRAAGFADREARRSMREDCIFLLASVAKPIVTAAALRLIEDGRISLGDSVRRWLPEFEPRLADGSVPEITIHHLLTHSADLTYVFMEEEDGPYHRLRISSGFDRTDVDLDEIVRRISATPLVYEPGTGWGYSMAIDVLGAVIEKVTQQSLARAVADLVLKPLTNTTFEGMVGRFPVDIRNAVYGA